MRGRPRWPTAWPHEASFSFPMIMKDRITDVVLLSEEELLEGVTPCR